MCVHHGFAETSADARTDFHADPHHGNLLIRPKAPKSSSPFKFDVVLLDHGQYFDIPDDLRVNYARFWLSLIAGNSPDVLAQRRKYARLVANIDDDLVSRVASHHIGVALLTSVLVPDLGDRDYRSCRTRGWLRGCRPERQEFAPPQEQ